MIKYFNKKSQVIFFLKRFGYLLKSNISVKDALEIIRNDTTDPTLKHILSDISTHINQGKSLTDSFRKHETYFSRPCVVIVENGEKIGKLNEVLLKFADFMDRRMLFHKKLLSALIYPCVILTVFLFSIIFLIHFVFPKIIDLFNDGGVALPLITRFFIFSIDFFQSYGLILILAISILICLLVKYIGRYKMRLSKFILKTPVISEFILKIELFNFTTALQLMLSGGFHFLDGFLSATSFIRNIYLKDKLQAIYTSSLKGKDISLNLNEAKDVLPSFFVAILNAAIKDGDIEGSLTYLSDTYEKDIDILTETIIKILEPIIILALGVLIGFFVIAILLPLLELNQINL